MSEMSKAQKMAVTAAFTLPVVFTGCAGMQSQPMTPEREHCREMTSNIDYMSTLRNAGWGGLAGAATGALTTNKRGSGAAKGAAAGAVLGAVIDIGMQYTENNRLENECVRNYGAWSQKFNEYNQGVQPAPTEQPTQTLPPTRNAYPAPGRR